MIGRLDPARRAVPARRVGDAYIQQGDADARTLPPSRRELCLVLALIGLYVGSAALAGQSSYAFLNAFGPIALSLILTYGAWRLVRGGGKRLWTPLFWFRISTIVYFGIGTFLVLVISPAERGYLEAFYWFWDEDVFKLNLVVAVSVLVVLGNAWAVTRFSLRRQRWTQLEEGGDTSNQDLPRVAIAFLLIGFAVKFLLKIPHDFGWISGEVPGAIMNAARLAPAGIFLITLWGLRRSPKTLPVIFVLVAVELLLQVLLFAKGDFLIVLMMFVLPFLWERVTLKSLVGCGALAITAFTLLQPIVADGRRELESRYGEDPQAGFGERFDIVRKYLVDGGGLDDSGGGATALTRVSYVNVATFVIARYDAGHPGDWPEMLPAVFVPRLLWPDKPIITDIAKDIYELGTGRRTSQVGAGLFADAYWAMGWTGVVLFMSIYGAILGALTTLTMRLLDTGRWLFFPIILMSVQQGMRTDGHYVADVAGGTVILVGWLAVLYVVERALRSAATMTARGGRRTRRVAVP